MKVAAVMTILSQRGQASKGHHKRIRHKREVALGGANLKKNLILTELPLTHSQDRLRRLQEQEAY